MVLKGLNAEAIDKIIEEEINKTVLKEFKKVDFTNAGLIDKKINTIVNSITDPRVRWALEVILKDAEDLHRVTLMAFAMNLVGADVEDAKDWALFKKIGGVLSD